ncbi:MAG TPA: heme o synthase [Actinomycetota bacterium]|nr:heme o synthase [Actinomycetota bacterium]
MNRFQKLSVATTAMTMFLIGVGGTVRASGSGLGCPDWPRCHGKWYPPLTFHSIVEYSHRTAASIVIVLVLATAAYAWVRYRSVATIFWPAFSALIVIGFQAFLGELVVKSKLNPHLVVVHFATSLALLALVTLTTVNSFRPRGGRFGPLAKEAAGVAAGTAVVAILGAYVTQWNAALVFADWPLFDGRVIPPFAGHPGAVIQFVHRLAAALLGVAIIHLAVRMTRAKARKPLLILGWVAVATWALQAVAGAAQIWTSLSAWAVAAHVLGGGGLWGAAVALAFASYRLTAGSPRPGSPGSGVGGPEGGGPDGGGSQRAERPGGSVGSRVRAYFLLTKPRVVELLLITTVPAMVVAARGWPSVGLILATLVGGSLAAGGAGAINCFVDRDIDDVMERTHSRPVPAGAIEPPRALVFGIVLEVLSFAFLALTVNVLAASLAVGATVFYVFVYTLWLKRATPSNIVIGGAAGAAPVLVGWAAVTGHVGLPALVMFAIIFYWTPPHFWALSLRYTEDYAAAKVPMLPVVRGPEATARHIVLYTLSLAGISLVLYPVTPMGPIYLVSALVLGGLFVRRALALQRRPSDPREAMRLFHFSIAHLSLLFVAMAADRLIGGSFGSAETAVQGAVFVAGAVAFCVSQAAIGYEALRWRRAGGGEPRAAAFLDKKASPSHP